MGARARARRAKAKAKAGKAKAKAKAEAVVGDEECCITMCLYDAQVDLVKPGQELILRNAAITMYKGYIRCTVDKWGKIEVANETSSRKVNVKKNLSLVEYELVRLG